MSLAFLCHFDGEHGATTAKDWSPIGHAITFNGAAALDGGYKKFGRSAVALDGAGDYLSVAAHSDFDIAGAGYGDFTIDAWVYFIPAAASFHSLCSRYIDANNNFDFYIWDDAGVCKIGVWLKIGGVIAVDLAGGSVPTNQWTHLAVTRSGNWWRMFIDGQSAVEYDLGVIGTISWGSAPLVIGQWNGANDFPGYIDEFRVLKGQAEWTASFTPATAPYTPPFIAAAQVERIYSFLTSVAAQTARLYGAVAAAQVTRRWGVIVASQTERPYALLAPVASQRDRKYDLLPFVIVAAAIERRYGAVAAAQTARVYSLLVPVAAQAARPYTATNPVAAQTERKYDLLNYVPVAAQTKRVYSLLESVVVNITDQPVIYYGGRKMEIIAASIRQDEGDYAWTAEIELAHVEDYARMKINGAFTLDLYGEVFSLIVDNKAKTRTGPAQTSLRVAGISPSARHAFPRAEPFSKTWTEAVMARAAAEEALGEAIDWQIVDWQIPAGRLAFVDAAPIAVAERIAEAAGAVVETAPDGTVTVRPRFPASVPAWDSAAVAHVYTDPADNLSAEELSRATERVNAVTIRDFTSEAGSTQDIVEFIADEDDPLKGTVCVYPRPWRPVELVHTGNAAVGMNYQGEVTLTKYADGQSGDGHESLVEFKAGRASVRYPVMTINSVTWHYAALGAVAASGPELQSAAAAYSLARIEYTTRAYKWRVWDAAPDTIQFLVCEKG